MKRFLLLVCILFNVTVALAQPKENKISPELQKLQQDILSTNSPISTPNTPSTTPSDQAKEILSNPLYRESLDTSKGESWLAQAINNLFEKIADWFSNMFKNEQKEQTGSFGAAPMIIQGIIVILIAALIGFLIFMLAQIRLKRKVPIEDSEGLISKEEANRSADQWLKEADRLASEGLFREAIRCLYLACLIRMDEQRVLRFERHETNWEHLHRFRDLPSKPGGFDLQPATQKFDHAWYGLVPQDQSDVNWFKDEYQLLLDGLRQARS
jgi:hypothetical protein